MRSGIEFRENYVNPVSHVAKYYYGRNLLKYTYNLKIKDPPGEKYDYASCNSQILALILEKTTGMSLPKYLEEKLWSKMGTAYDASWNLDSKKHRTVKAFCCLNARLHDFAKFGRLYLNQGRWNGTQLIPKNWIAESLEIRNDSRDDDGFPYTYFWRVLDNGSFFAKGIKGQYIYIHPAKELIILRFGHSYDDVDWVSLFDHIGSQF
jgi:CubicO group peptidase (beta-lactamase class C family)